MRNQTQTTFDRAVLATGNPHKLEELRPVLLGESVSLELLTLRDVPTPTTEPKETGGTFEENATIKALSYAQQTGMVCLADDSGLEVDTLQGRPGVISSHYSTDGRETGLNRDQRDEANNQRVLTELRGVAAPLRGGRFVCVMVVAVPGPDGPRAVFRCRGTFEGRIGEEGQVPRGSNGFGYDPLFLVAPEFAITSAELSPGEKNERSHRGSAARQLAAWLKGDRAPNL